MPVILHASSTCDVCLESFLSLEGEVFAIPCGHLFCLNCLQNIRPPTCPMCRRSFAHERAKRIYIELPERDEAREWTDRLVAAFDSSGEMHRVSSGFETWLRGQSDDHAWNAAKEYHALAGVAAQREEETRRLVAEKSDLAVQVTELFGQVTQLRAQIEPLQSEISSLRHTKNPLPAPPQPVDLSRFPSFARPAAESAEGYLASSRRLDLFAAPSSSSNRKGKSRQRHSPPSPYSAGHHDLPRGSNVIIPGATPSQRVVPSPDNVSGHAYVTPLPATAYVNGYSTGYHQGYHAANPNPNGGSQAASTSSYRLPIRESDEEDSLEAAIGGLQLWGVPAASASIASAQRSLDSAPPTRHYPTIPERAPAEPASHTTPPSAIRRSTAPVDSQPRAPQPPPIYRAPTESGLRFESTLDDPPSRRQTHQRNRNSYSSWGTVHSQASSAHTQNSLGDLSGLRNLPGARRGPVLDRGLVETPTVIGTPQRHAHNHSVAVPETHPPSFELYRPRTSVPDNALGLDLGPTPLPTISAPTPRVQLTGYVNSWDLR
ncbi:RING-type domain-containing protein [Mycena chlorophos]|uniref:RING-type domain-containing protein n=1 Tax=Mycena chlorophos TaxID=658473 RepID=A0A8H6WBY2_MYCCL|nr:RING-type domain-containing protein [Mycena chlorophos]